MTPTPDPLTASDLDHWRKQVADRKVDPDRMWRDADVIVLVARFLDALAQPAPALDVERLTAALGDILDLSKGEPRMGGGSTFPANAHRMGRIHNVARAAFGESPLTILAEPQS